VSPDTDSAQVVIKRERAWSGSLLPWTVWLDGEKVGTVSVGGSLTVLASPGQHDIVVSPPGLGSFSVKSEPFRFHAGASDRVDLVTEASLISGRPKILQPGVADSQPHLADRLQQYAERWQENLSPDLRSNAPAPPGPTAPADPVKAILLTPLRASHRQCNRRITLRSADWRGPPSHSPSRAGGCRGAAHGRHIPHRLPRRRRGSRSRARGRGSRISTRSPV